MSNEKMGTIEEQITAISLKKDHRRRELLGETAEAIITICNKIYKNIDRRPRESISDKDLALVKTFNQLEKVNIGNLDILYPYRGVGSAEKAVRSLSFRNNVNSIDEETDIFYE